MITMVVHVSPAANRYRTEHPKPGSVAEDVSEDAGQGKKARQNLV
jgi:hypothetical protein